jgi:acetyl esterase/lipase
MAGAAATPAASATAQAVGGGAPSPSHSRALFVEPDEVIELWPGGVPGREGVTVTQSEVDRAQTPGLYDPAIMHVTKPTLSVYRAKNPTGASVMLIPGGGYVRVVVGKEGYEIVRELNARGITAYVLLYRLPADGWAAGPDAPLQDAQRGLRWVRANAARLGVDAAKIGVMGFSAGGHLAAHLATRFDKPVYEPTDASDRVSARPDFCALGYPVISTSTPHAHKGSRDNLIGRDAGPEREAAYSPDKLVTANTPPTFIMHAVDDATVPVENAILMFQALRASKVPAEMHIFETGGHGFGLRDVGGKAVAAWPDLLLRWAGSHGHPSRPKN